MVRVLILVLGFMSFANLPALAQGGGVRVAPMAVSETYTLELAGVTARRLVCTATSSTNPRTATCASEESLTCPTTEVLFRARANAATKTCAVSCTPSRSMAASSTMCMCTLKESDCR